MNVPVPRRAPRTDDARQPASGLSFRARLTLRWTLVFGLILTAALVLVFVSARAFGYTAVDLHLRTVAATELASSTDQGASIHLHELPVGALNEQEFAPKFSVIWAADGSVVAHTGGIRPDEFEVDADFLAQALAGASPLVDIEWGDRRGRLIGLRALDLDGTPHVLAVGMLADRLDDSLARLLWVLAGVWIGALGLTAVVGHRLASRALEPIDRITERARAIAYDRIDDRLDPPATDDEIGRMTRLLNEMIDRLHAVIDANRRFAADASHELRSPLTAIAGEIDVTLKRERSADEYAETLRVVRNRLTEMFTLADNLTLLVQAEEQAGTVPLRPVPVRGLLSGVAARLRAAAAQRQITLDLPTRGLDALRVFGDAGLLGRALDNVVGNALQYTAPGGRVDVTIQWHPPPGDDAWATGRVLIRVRDTGRGIPVSEWERIFDRFHRLDDSRSRRTGGTGLGLPIARAIVTLMGGTLRVAESHVARSSPVPAVHGPQAETAHGTTFEIDLPGEDGVHTAGDGPIRPAG
jgi:two-component system, OmpR family, sensor kinase